MTTELQVFTHVGQDVRTLVEDGEVLFVAADVARVLGYRDAHNMTRRLEPDDKGTRSVSTLGGEQDTTVITEPGLYAAILGSWPEGATPPAPAPAATAPSFRHWRPGMVAHRHEDVEEARACEAEQADLLARLAEVRWAS